MRDIQPSRRQILGGALAAAGLAGSAARAARPVLRIGVLGDQSGPYRDLAGLGALACARQAVAEFGAGSFDVEIVTADHQNKPDVGAAIARQWFDRDGVDMVTDLTNSAVALAVAQVARAKNKVALATATGTTELTGRQCSANSLHWSYDVYMLARSTALQVVKSGGRSWYFVAADYVFGRQLQGEAAATVAASGGTVLGTSFYPFPGTSDFSSFLLAGQSSGADVIGFANAGADLVNGLKQAHEFGLSRRVRLAALSGFISDIDAVGLEVAQGLNLTSSFYWDLNERTRALSARVRPTMPRQAPPTMAQAGTYSGTLHYLKTVAAMGLPVARDGAATVAQMKATPCDDDAFGSFRVRADGRVLVPAYLFRVKSPAESRGPWDYYAKLATTPPDEAAPPLGRGCVLVKE